MKKIIVLFLFAFFTSLKFSFASFLDEAISNPDRTYEFVKRDKYRHPKETLNFFGIKSKNLKDTINYIIERSKWIKNINT